MLQEEGFAMNQKKIEALLKIEKLSCVKEVRSFLGMVQFLHKFIKNLAGKTIYLTEALKKRGEFQWTPEMQLSLIHI